MEVADSTGGVPLTEFEALAHTTPFEAATKALSFRGATRRESEKPFGRQRDGVVTAERRSATAEDDTDPDGDATADEEVGRASRTVVRTRGGRCVVGDDAVRLEESTREYLRNCWRAYRRRATAFTHVVVAGLLVAIAASAVLLNVQGDPWAVAFDVVFVGVLLGVACAWAFVRSRDDGDVVTIPLADVVEVYAIDATGGASRPRMVLVHRTDEGLARRYVVPLRTAEGDGVAAATRAFRAAGVRVTE